MSPQTTTSVDQLSTKVDTSHSVEPVRPSRPQPRRKGSGLLRFVITVLVLGAILGGTYKVLGPEKSRKVVEYLKEGWTKPQLKSILEKLGLTARDILRIKGNEAHEHVINNPNSTEDELLDAMVGHPILVERPIVITPKGAVVARPADKVDPIL